MGSIRHCEGVLSLIGLVGYVSTAKQEYERLGYPTSRNIMDPDEFILTPQVYHDLHCLLSHPTQKAFVPHSLAGFTCRKWSEICSGKL